MGDKYEVKDDGSIVVANLAADPANPDSGQFYFNSGSKLLRVFNGTIWQTIDTDDQTLQQVLTIGNTATTSIILDDANYQVTGAPTGNVGVDLSGMDNPSIIKLKMYSQASQPTLGADGELALWSQTPSNRLFLLARNNSTTKAVEIS